MKVLISLAPALPQALPELRQEYPLVQFESILEVPDLAAAIADADVYVGMLNRDLFLAAKQLRWIQAPSTGVDSFLTIPELVESDVQLTSARYAQRLCGRKCPGHDPGFHARNPGVRIEHLDDLLRLSDYVVVTVPLTVRTRGMIGAEQLALTKNSVMLVVISRGGVVNEKALAQALREKHIAAAALDVFETEPLPADSELWNLPNLLITPHIAGSTQFEAQHLLAIFRENLDRFL